MNLIAYHRLPFISLFSFLRSFYSCHKVAMQLLVIPVKVGYTRATSIL